MSEWELGSKRSLKAILHESGRIDLAVHAPTGAWVTVAYDVHESTLDSAFGLTTPTEIGIRARLVLVWGKKCGKIACNLRCACGWKSYSTKITCEREKDTS